MKTYLILLYSITCLISCNVKQTDSFTLQGTITGYQDKETITLSYYSIQAEDRGYQITDTAEIINGKFTFRGNIEELTLAYLHIDNGNHSIELYLEPVRMKLKIDRHQPYKYKLTGTQTQNEIAELKKETLPYEKIVYEKSELIHKSVDRIEACNDSTIRDSLSYVIHKYADERDINNKKIHEIYAGFASNHIAYKITPTLLYLTSKENCISNDLIKFIYTTLPEYQKKSLMGKLAQKQIQDKE